jgi:hypothetical protein
MTITKIALVGVLIAVMLGLAKTQHWFERAGLVSSCQSVPTPYGRPSGEAWYMCREGIITGFPTLERDSCESAGIVAQRQELWRCQAVLGSTPGL